MHGKRMKDTAKQSTFSPKVRGVWLLIACWLLTLLFVVAVVWSLINRCWNSHLSNWTKTRFWISNIIIRCTYIDVIPWKNRYPFLSNTLLARRILGSRGVDCAGDVLYESFMRAMWDITGRFPPKSKSCFAVWFFIRLPKIFAFLCWFDSIISFTTIVVLLVLPLGLASSLSPQCQQLACSQAIAIAWNLFATANNNWVKIVERKLNVDCFDVT